MLDIMIHLESANSRMGLNRRAQIPEFFNYGITKDCLKGLMMADVGENSNKAALSGLLCRWVGGSLRPAAGGIHPPPLLPVFVHHPPSSPPSPTSSLSTSQDFTLPAGHQEPQTFRSPIDSDTTGRTTVSVSISYCLIFCLTCGGRQNFP